MMFPILWRSETLALFLRQLLSFYLSITTTILECIFYPLTIIQWFPVYVPYIDDVLSFYFRYCNLSSCTVDLDDQTTVHFWAPSHRKFYKPNLVLIHGYGGNAKWQFVFQVGSLAQSFNLYVPDLLFFGKSYTKSADRTDVFQARCLSDGLKKLGVEKYSIYAISYGGYVGYRMAEMGSEIVNKVVILSSGIGCTEDSKQMQLRSVGMSALDLLLPNRPQDLRALVNLSFSKYKPLKWVPDIFLFDFITVMCKTNRKEKKELAEHLIAKVADCDFRTIDQETLLIWGDKDMLFPLPLFGYQLHRRLAPKAKLKIIEDTGHAANLESANSVNELIKAFVLDSP